MYRSIYTIITDYILHMADVPVYVPKVKPSAECFERIACAAGEAPVSKNKEIGETACFGRENLLK